MSKNKHAQVFHFDLYGKREDKYDFLNQQSIDGIQWAELEVKEPGYFFVKKDFEGSREYEKGVIVDELFIVTGRGISFRKDNLLVKNHDTEDSVKVMITDIQSLESNSLKAKYKFGETNDWLLKDKKKYFDKYSVTDIRKVVTNQF